MEIIRFARDAGIAGAKVKALEGLAAEEQQRMLRAAQQVVDASLVAELHVGRPVARAYFETTRAEARAALGLGRIRSRAFGHDGHNLMRYRPEAVSAAILSVADTAEG